MFTIADIAVGSASESPLVSMSGHPVAFRLNGIVPEATKPRRGSSQVTNQVDRLRLATLDGLRSRQIEQAALEIASLIFALLQRIPEIVLVPVIDAQVALDVAPIKKRLKALGVEISQLYEFVWLPGLDSNQRPFD